MHPTQVGAFESEVPPHAGEPLTERPIVGRSRVERVILRGQHDQVIDRNALRFRQLLDASIVHLLLIAVAHRPAPPFHNRKRAAEREDRYDAFYRTQHRLRDGVESAATGAGQRTPPVARCPVPPAPAPPLACSSVSPCRSRGFPFVGQATALRHRSHHPYRDGSVSSSSLWPACAIRASL